MAAINADHPQLGMRQAFEEVVGAGAVADYDYLALHRAGHSVAQINDGFVAAVRAFHPDWVWLQVQESGIISADTVRAAAEACPTAVISHWMGDCRRTVPSYLASICAATDLTLVSNAGQLDMFRAAGARRAEYCQIGLDFQEDVLGLPAWTPPFHVPDVVFCGNHYGMTFPAGPDRLRAIWALRRAGVQVGVVGTGWPAGFPVLGQCGVKQQHHIYTRAKVALSLSHFNDIALYYSDRQLVAMASGTPVVCQYVPRLETEFTDGVHCMFFRSVDTLIKKVTTLLDDKPLRVRIGAAGKTIVVERHTWAARFRQILPIITSLHAKKPTL